MLTLSDFKVVPTRAPCLIVFRLTRFASPDFWFVRQMAKNAQTKAIFGVGMGIVIRADERARRLWLWSGGVIEGENHSASIANFLAFLKSWF